MNYFFLCLVTVTIGNSLACDVHLTTYVTVIICTNLSTPREITVEHPGTMSKVLKFKETHFMTLPPLGFSKIDSLTELHLNNTHIMTAEIGAFEGLPKLRKLYMNNNQLTTLSKGVYNSLSNLEILDLSNNEIKNVDSCALKDVDKLMELHLSFNLLTEFRIVDIPNLSFLNLSFCKISSLSNDTVTSNLIELRLEQNKIIILEDLIFNKCNKLRTLDVSFNHISKIYKNAFTELHQLQYLYMQHNEITKVNVSLFRDLSNLLALNLSHNHIKKFLFGTFDSLVNLQILDISHNELIYLFQYPLYPLTKLNDLSFGNNRIVQLNVNLLLDYFPELQKVDFKHFWNCRKIVDFYLRFKSKNVTMVKGTEYNVENVFGIPCYNNYE